MCGNQMSIVVEMIGEMQNFPVMVVSIELL